jgi:hypothetical protein
LFLALLVGANVVWLACRHEPWRPVAIPGVPWHSQQVVYTPSGKLLVLGHVASVFDPDTGERICVMGKMSSGADRDRRVYPLLGGREVLEILDDGLIVYDAETGRTVRAFSFPLRGPVPAADAVTPAPDGRRFYGPARFDPDAYNLYGLPRPEPQFYLWDLDAARRPREPLLPSRRFPFKGGVTLSPDGRTALVTNDKAAGTAADPYAALFDIRSGGEIPLEPPMPSGRQLPMFSADSQWLEVEVVPGLGTWMYSTRTGKVLPSPGAAWAPWPEQAASGDGGYLVRSYVAVGMRDRTVELYALDGVFPRWLATHRVHGGASFGAVFFPDGSRIIGRGDGGVSLAIYDLKLRPLARMDGPALREWTFSPDGGHLAAFGPWSEVYAYRKVGLECRETMLGVLGMPHAWLLLALVGLTALLLQRDARRLATARGAGRRVTWIALILLLAGLPRSAQAVLTTCVGHVLPTFAPVVLISAVGLATGARFWRMAAVGGLAVSVSITAWWVLALKRGGLSGSIVFRLVDRSWAIPEKAVAVTLVVCSLGAVGAMVMLVWPSRRLAVQG